MRPRLLTALFFLGAVLILLAPIKTPFNFYDEGFALFDATRILAGAVPYRDFWVIYPPGQFYAIAAAFGLFGQTVLVARIYDTLLRLLIVVSIYFLAQRLTTRPLAWLIGLATALLLASVHFYAYAVFPALAWGLMAIACVWHHAQTGARRWLFLAGLFNGLALCFRWDIGLYASLSVALARLLFDVWAHPSHSLKQTGAQALQHLALSLGGALLVAVLGYGAVGVQSGFNNLWDQAFAFPVTWLHDARWVPYPALFPPLTGYPAFSSWLQFYLPVALYASLSVYYVFFLLRQRQAFAATHLILLTLTGWGGLLFAQALNRYDYIHVVPASIVALLVCVALLHQELSGLRQQVFKYSLGLAGAALAALYFYAPFTTFLTTAQQFPPWGCYSHLAIASCVYVAGDQEQAVDYVRTQATPQEPIFVGNRRHDQIFVSDIGFYFLAQHPSPSPYHELEPGVATTEAVQTIIVQALQTQNVQWVIRVNIPDSKEPNASALSSGVHLLDDFIAAHYAPVAEFGAYQVLHKIEK